MDADPESTFLKWIRIQDGHFNRDPDPKHCNQKAKKRRWEECQHFFEMINFITIGTPVPYLLSLDLEFGSA